jgi:hypothetical protein
MFCNKCQEFWKDAIAKATVPEAISKSAEVQWAQYEVTLHSSMSELKSSSNFGCKFCRSIYTSPTKWELEDLLAKEEEIHIILELKSSQGPPVISSTFIEPSVEGKAPKIRIPKRMLASGASLLTDGKPSCHAKISSLKLGMQKSSQLLSSESWHSKTTALDQLQRYSSLPSG